MTYTMKWWHSFPLLNFLFIHQLTYNLLIVVSKGVNTWRLDQNFLDDKPGLLRSNTIYICLLKDYFKPIKSCHSESIFLASKCTVFIQSKYLPFAQFNESQNYGFLLNAQEVLKIHGKTYSACSCKVRQRFNDSQ